MKKKSSPENFGATDKTENMQRHDKHWQFAPGESGNPAGRPKGSRNKATLAVQALLEGEAEDITRKAIESAKAGDMQAIKLVLERLLPPRKDMPIELALPVLRSSADMPSVLSAILEAVSTGQITPSEAQALSGVAEQCRKAIEMHELEARLLKLEERNLS